MCYSPCPQSWIAMKQRDSSDKWLLVGNGSSCSPSRSFGSSSLVPQYVVSCLASRWCGVLSKLLHKRMYWVLVLLSLCCKHSTSRSVQLRGACRTVLNVRVISSSAAFSLSKNWSSSTSSTCSLFSVVCLVAHPFVSVSLRFPLRDRTLLPVATFLSSLPSSRFFIAVTTGMVENRVEAEF